MSTNQPWNLDYTVMRVRAVPLARYLSAWYCTCIGATTKTLKNSAGGSAESPNEIAKVVCTCSQRRAPRHAATLAGASEVQDKSRTLGASTKFTSCFLLFVIPRENIHWKTHIKNYRLNINMLVFKKKKKTAFPQTTSVFSRKIPILHSNAPPVSEAIISVKFELCNSADWAQLWISSSYEYHNITFSINLSIILAI